MANERRAGLIQFQVNGEMYDAKGEYSYELSGVKRETIVGADGVHGYKETPKAGYIEGSITDRGSLDVAAMVALTDATVILKLSNGKSIVGSNSWFAGDGKASTSESQIDVRFEGKNVQEIS